MKEDEKNIAEEKKRWEEKTLKPAPERFKLKESPTAFYSPLELEEGFHFLDKVGFPLIPLPRALLSTPSAAAWSFLRRLPFIGRPGGCGPGCSRKNSGPRIKGP